MLEQQLELILQSPYVRTLGALILLDIILGIAAAIHTQEFRWKELARFYLTMVLPYLIGFVGLALAIPLMVGDLLGPYTELLNKGLVSLAWLALMGTLVSSIVENGKALYGAFPPEH